MKQKIVALLALIFVASSVPLGRAEESTTGEKPRPIGHERARVRQGVRSGELTKEEAQKIREDRKAHREMVQKARADGKVTPEERIEIKKDRARIDQEIHDLKHNDAKREPAQPAPQK